MFFFAANMTILSTSTPYAPTLLSTIKGLEEGFHNDLKIVTQHGQDKYCSALLFAAISPVVRALGQ